MIYFGTAAGSALNGRLTYSEVEQSFEFVPDGSLAELAPSSQEGTTGLVVDSLQLETAVEDGRVLYAWGYYPRNSWQNAKLQLPPAADGLCTAHTTGDELVPGVSERVSKAPWITEFDPTNRVLRVASGAEPLQHVTRIATGVYVGVQDDQLIELWLQPELVDETR
jgi:hypothetical protein